MGVKTQPGEKGRVQHSPVFWSVRPVQVQKVMSGWMRPPKLFGAFEPAVMADIICGVTPRRTMK